MNKNEFIAREVWNQGWRSDDYFLRVGLMHEAWESIMHISPEDIRHAASTLEPNVYPYDSWRTCNVTVGGRLCPRSEELNDLMNRWQNHLSEMTPLEAYKEFEYIHPFVDGNGRVGKIIYNFLMGTMNDPTFPHVPEWGEG